MQKIRMLALYNNYNTVDKSSTSAPRAGMQDIVNTGKVESISARTGQRSSPDVQEITVHAIVLLAFGTSALESSYQHTSLPSSFPTVIPISARR